MSGIDPITDFDSLRQAMADNFEQPEGPARNARAELLLAEAEKLGIPLAVIEALAHQLKVYNYSSEKDKMFVPFARLLRMWDESPEDFDEYEVHSLHWVFKWLSAGMLDQPHIPLASIEKWLGEMEYRYRLAGHSERAVRSAEFSVASHVGDVERAERAYAAAISPDPDAPPRIFLPTRPSILRPEEALRLFAVAPGLNSDTTVLLLTRRLGNQEWTSAPARHEGRNVFSVTLGPFGAAEVAIEYRLEARGPSGLLCDPPGGGAHMATLLS